MIAINQINSIKGFLCVIISCYKLVNALNNRAGSFQNFSVLVLDLDELSVPVPTVFTKSFPFKLGFRDFGFSVLTVQDFSLKELARAKR